VSQVPAAAWLVYDRATDLVLFSRNAQSRREPASITKLMTAYLVFEALRDSRFDLHRMIEVPPEVRRVGGPESRMYLRPGSRATVEELLNGLLIVSANDAAVTLAIALAGSEEAFVSRMNAAAARLGMSKTHYENVSGIPAPSHYTTANDLLRLTAALDRQFPQIYAISAQEGFRYRKFERAASNDLLSRHMLVDGLKTGHTKSAGYNIVVSTRHRAGSPSGGGDLFVIVLGSETRKLRNQAVVELLRRAAPAGLNVAPP
jgi:D-alanyl-D-alanine carboxypeptidase (penicillin-binding protein 5/6)